MPKATLHPTIKTTDHPLAEDTRGETASSFDSQEMLRRVTEIPADSVTARTAGALHSSLGRQSVEAEREAFERAVADENALPREELSGTTSFPRH